MKRVFNFKGKYYDYRPQKIMFQIARRGKFKDLPDKYIGKYFFSYLYPWNDYSTILTDDIIYDEYEDDDGETETDNYYDWTWIVVNDYHYSNIYTKQMKGIKIIDKFPREGDDWDGPEQSKCFGWTGRTYNECDYEYVSTNHDY